MSKLSLLDKIERGKRTQVVRSMTNSTASSFASELGISRQALNFWENGKGSGLTNSGAEKVIKVARTHGIVVNLTWLLYEIGSGPTFVNNSEKTEISPEILSKYPLLDKLENHIQWEILCLANQNPLISFFDIQDDSMSPFLEKGDIVAGKILNPYNFKEGLSKYCIVQTDTIGPICRLVKAGEGSLFNLVAINDVIYKTISNVQLIKMAPITWIRKIYP